MAKGFRGSWLLAGLMLWCVSTWTLALSCDSCGRECASACGTRSFRTCCFNYLRKRSGDGGADGGPGLRLELLVAPEQLTRLVAARSAAEEQEEEEHRLPSSSRMQLVYNA